MGLLDRLFGKKENPVTATHADKEAFAPDKQDQPVTAGNSKPPAADTDPLKRWKDSGKARAWVAAHHGHWNHQDWLGLLDELKRSGFWPVAPEAVGAVLEELKREWSRRN